jgi:hypothetical protein
MIASSTNDTCLIVSDIHADIKALNTIIEIVNDRVFVERYGKINTIINLGDTVGRGFHPVEVIERLAELGAGTKLISIMGNHDESFLYDWPVSGDDAESIRAHEEFKRAADSGSKHMKSCLDFLKDMLPYYVDHKHRILAVHGGPLDPEKIAPPGLKDYDAWLYQRTWQRISESGHEYLDNAGYHYTPRNAFIQARDFWDRGFIIMCGHQHTVAVYRNMDDKVERISDEHMEMRKETYAGYAVQVNEFDREKDMNYLIRVGIAGPEGYYKVYRWNRSYFAILRSENGVEKVGLFETQLEY